MACVNGHVSASTSKPCGWCLKKGLHYAAQTSMWHCHVHEVHAIEMLPNGHILWYEASVDDPDFREPCNPHKHPYKSKQHPFDPNHE